MAEGVDAYRKQCAIFPVMIAMEMLDQEACERVAAKLGGAPIFCSAQLDMFQMVSILRHAIACFRRVFTQSSLRCRPECLRQE